VPLGRTIAKSDIYYRADYQKQDEPDFEKIRASDQQQIKQLQDNLELLHQSSQTNQGLVTQCDKLIKKLQARLTLTENTTIDISAFKTQASEINERLEVAQQELYLKVDAIRNVIR
jgi:hypothetical protein